MEIGNFEGVVLTLEFEVKNGRQETKQLPNTAPFRGRSTV